MSWTGFLTDGIQVEREIGLSGGNSAEGWAGAVREELTLARPGTVGTAESQGCGVDMLNLWLVLTKLT